MTKFHSLLEDFFAAVDRLDEVLREKKTDIVRDSAIKRFELCFELAWKTAKAFLEEEHSTTCVSPRNCFREAFRVRLIEHEAVWLDLTSDRNYTAHTYNQKLAEKIYADLPKALEAFKTLLTKLREQQMSENSD